MRRARARARASAAACRAGAKRRNVQAPGVDELEAEIAEKKRWLVQLDSPGGEKEVRELMRAAQERLGAAAGATDPGSMFGKYGLAPPSMTSADRGGDRRRAPTAERRHPPRSSRAGCGAGGAGAARPSQQQHRRRQRRPSRAFCPRADFEILAARQKRFSLFAPTAWQENPSRRVVAFPLSRAHGHRSPLSRVEDAVERLGEAALRLVVGERRSRARRLRHAASCAP